MTTYKPEFAKGATNVYRTENYIVKQVFGISLDSSLGNVTMSYDTYYLRTPDLDAIYEYMFSDRKKTLACGKFLSLEHARNTGFIQNRFHGCGSAGTVVETHCNTVDMIRRYRKHLSAAAIGGRYIAGIINSGNIVRRNQR